MKKVISFTVIIISLIIIKNLAYSIYGLLQKENLIDSARLELRLEQGRNKDLRSNLKKAQSKSFIEQEARDKLLLVKPNEHDVLVSKSLAAENNSLLDKKKVVPDWKAWLALFF